MTAPEPFFARTKQGEDFYVDYDGAEDNALWFSSDEGNFSVSLNHEASYQFYHWLKWWYTDGEDEDA